MVSEISTSDLGALAVNGRCGGDDIWDCSKDAKLCRCMQVVKNICTVENVSRFDRRCVHSQWIPQGFALSLEGWPDWVPVLQLGGGVIAPCS